MTSALASLRKWALTCTRMIPVLLAPDAGSTAHASKRGRRAHKSQMPEPDGSGTWVNVAL